MSTAMVPVSAEVSSGRQALEHPEAIEFAHIQRVGNMFVQSGFFSDSQQVAQACVKIMAGREVGVPPVASMMGINIIKGKVAMGANLLASRVRAHGYDYRVKRLDKTGCELLFLGKEKKDGTRDELGLSSFTNEDALTAGTSNEHYKKNPRNMFFARAMSNGVKWHTPEITAGIPVYMAEELVPVNADGEEIHDPRGSVEAAQDVAKRKLTEMRKLQPAVPEEEVPEQKHPDDNQADALNRARNLCRTAFGDKLNASAMQQFYGVNSWSKIAKLTAEELDEGSTKLAARIEQTEQDATELEPFWKDHFSMLHSFAEQKKRIGESQYYGILNAYGMASSKDFGKDFASAMRCYVDLRGVQIPQAVTPPVV